MKKFIKKFFTREFDISISLLLFIVFVTYVFNIYAIFATIIYGTFRSFFSKSFLYILINNLIILFFVIIFPISIIATNENQIILNIIIVVLLIIIATIQILFMIFIVFTSKIGVYPKSDFKVINKIRKMSFLNNVTKLSAKLLVAIIYPLLLTLVIIISFSGFYSTLNNYYSSNKYVSNNGLYYIQDNTKLETISYKEAPILKNILLKLNKNGYIYFSSSTFFTIGYGDIVPKGELLRTIVIVEMIISHYLSISFFALFSVLFYKFLIEKKIKQADYLKIDEANSKIE